MVKARALFLAVIFFSIFIYYFDLLKIGEIKLKKYVDAENKVGSTFDQNAKNFRSVNQLELTEPSGSGFRNICMNSSRVHSRDYCVVNYAEGRDSFFVENVCVGGKKMLAEISQKHHKPMNTKGSGKFIVVYNASSNFTRHFYFFDVIFTTVPVPQGNTISKRRHVLFMSDHRKHFQNLHHIINDFALGVYALMLKFGFLFLSINSVVSNNDINTNHWTLPLLDFLRVDHHIYSNLSIRHVPDGTCFTKAFFIDPTFNPHVSQQQVRNPVHRQVNQLISFWRKSLNVSVSQCPRGNAEKSSFKIHVINRNIRKILNMDEVITGLKKAGFHNAQSITYEDYSMREQMFEMTCTDLLIGVQGAGLQWTSFMKPGAAMIEIAWPTAGRWHYFYADYDFASRWYPDVRIFQFETFNITATFLQKARRYFENFYYLRHKKEFQNTEHNRELHRKEIEKTPPAKWADAWVNVTELVTLVTDVYNGKRSHAPMKRFKYSKKK